MMKLARILATLALLAACSKESKQGEATAIGPGGLAAVDAVMAPYDECRAALAADKSDLSSCGAKLAEVATAAGASAPESARPHLTAIAGRAAKLDAGADVAAARTAFGEVSEPLVALVTAVKEAHDRYHVFECPMATGYNRWVQREAKMANPYMGTQMLECGTEVEMQD